MRIVSPEMGKNDRGKDSGPKRAVRAGGVSSFAPVCFLRTAPRVSADFVVGN